MVEMKDNSTPLDPTKEKGVSIKAKPFQPQVEYKYYLTKHVYAIEIRPKRHMTK